MSTEQLQSIHLEVIEKIQPYKKGSIEQAASSCTNISIDFAVEVLEGLIDAPTWSNAANYDVVQNKITELKKLLNR